MNIFQFYTLLMTLTTREETVYFLRLYREAGGQGINKEFAEETLMKEFEKRVKDTTN